MVRGRQGTGGMVAESREQPCAGLVRTGVVWRFLGSHGPRCARAICWGSRSLSSVALRTAALLSDGPLHDIQVQLADDSLHAVRIALREKSLEIVKGLDRAKLSGWCDVHNDWFVIARQVDDVVDLTGERRLVDQTGIEPVTS